MFGTGFIFINTNVEDERVVLIKPTSILNEMPQNSTSIEADNNLKTYQRHPITMEKYCLAEYIACFNVIFSKCKERQDEKEGELLEDNYDLDNVDDPHETDESNIDNFDEVHFAKDGFILQRRKVERIIYSVGFNKDHDKGNYYRELLMLYIPWRNENIIIGGSNSYEERYSICQNTIQNVRKKIFLSNTVDLYEIEREIRYDEESHSTIVTEMENKEDKDTCDGARNAKEYGCFNPDVNGEKNYDLGLDFGIGRKQVSNCDEQLSGEMLDPEYRELVQSLYQKEMEFFYHVLHLVKTTNDPIYNFLSGGAGVGKSLLLKALYQALIKFYFRKAGENPDDCSVLVCAPTGKAAYSVGG